MRFAGPEGYTVCVEVDRVDTPTMSRTSSVPDTNWVHLDARGHLHFHGADSWEAIWEPDWWCSDCHEYHTGSIERYVCSSPGCDETIRPHYREVLTPQSIPGRKRVYVIRPDGLRVDLTFEEITVLQEVGQEWLPEMMGALEPHRWH